MKKAKAGQKKEKAQVDLLSTVGSRVCLLEDKWERPFRFRRETIATKTRGINPKLSSVHHSQSIFCLWLGKDSLTTTFTFSAAWLSRVLRWLHRLKVYQPGFKVAFIHPTRGLGWFASGFCFGQPIPTTLQSELTPLLSFPHSWKL